MKTIIYSLTSLLFISGCSSGPTVQDGDLRILDKNVLGATYTVCESAVKWDGVTFSIEGLNAGLTTKSYTLGKLNYQPSQVREINTIALSVDALFRQMCQSTISLRRQPQALALYITERDKTAIKLFSLLQSMEKTNQSWKDAESVIKQQKNQFKEAMEAQN